MSTWRARLWADRLQGTRAQSSEKVRRVVVYGRLGGAVGLMLVGCLVIGLASVSGAEKRGREPKVFVFESPFRRVGMYRKAESRARAGDGGVWDHCGGDFHQPL